MKQHRKVVKLYKPMKGLHRKKIKHKNNVVIFNVKESYADSYRDKFQEDKNFCVELMTAVLKVGYEQSNVKTIHISGKQSEGSKRPLMVEFEDGCTKKHCDGRLSSAPERFKRVLITHVMTKKEKTTV